MALLIQLLVSVSAAFAMYRLVCRHNQAVIAELPYEQAMTRSFDPWLAAAGTALFAALVTPFVFYKMHGKVGILYGFAFLFGMIITSTTAQTVVAVLSHRHH